MSKTGKIIFPTELKANERPLIFAISLYDAQFKATQTEIKNIAKKYPDA